MNVHVRDWSAFVTPGEAGDAHMDLAVEGVHCAACMRRIESGLGGLAGVSAARLNLTTHRLAIDWRENEIDAGRIVGALEGMGFKAHPFDPAAARSRDGEEGRALLRCLAVAGFAAMNVMLLSISVWSGNVTDITPETRDFFHWISALIALPAVAYAGRPFFKSAFRAVAARSLNMDVPISIGVTLALMLSLLQTIQHAEHAYFDSAIMLLFFLLIGRFLDQNMRRQTRSFAENIAALRAETATKILSDGSLRDVPLSKVDPGDLVLVRAGERVSVDGVVEEGTSEIDQSLVTGETALAAVGRGAQVFAGTLNASGPLKIRVTAAANGTLLDEVNRLLETASQVKSRYVRLADRAASLYAPLVHGAAALAFLGWWLLAGLGWQPSLVIAISVLIITCPCALGLAIPAVQVVASGLLFKKGVLLNSGDALERLATVDTIVFDKTGTLTLPEPDLANRDAIAEDDLALAGRMAQASRHPLAAALVRATGSLSPVVSAREIAGLGVEAEISGAMVRLGSASFCGAEPDAVEAALADHPAASVIVLRHGERPPVLFLVEQRLRDDAASVVANLARAGYAIEILSGDREAAVGEVARALGIATFAAGLDPRGKIARLDALKAQGRTVLMVGDGLNDAPALASAHVSISPVTAVHLSQAAADAVFLGDKLGAVGSALSIARRARAVMHQNLWLAAGYNMIAVPFAVAGFVTPLLAALAMSGSSIVVTANALRLRWRAES
ncbi:heavy metal translocating P-type ATPase [Breoghania sp. L-A4]|uniref:heavy metal translocating P-type ATPase n=1 Tax=Breoghania sp. L-A4 TaxID=2304600 RepID=UPI000E35E960|nr:heavy metal translocating P-type ATPase [Breoghania sp. L-A4]AXS39677.1 cadmium-translocating P-type ATPase [Breoghania sp. L-A4]